MEKIYIGPELVKLNLISETKEDAIQEMSTLISNNTNLICNSDAFVKSIEVREKMMSTYCGEFIAIPHGLTDTVRTPVLAFGRSDGIEWDGEIVKYVFMFGIPLEYQNIEFEELNIIYDLIAENSKHIDTLKKIKKKDELIKLLKEGNGNYTE